MKNTSTSASSKTGTKASPLFAVLLILVMLFTLAFSIAGQYTQELDAAYASLRSSMYSLRSLIRFEGELEESFLSISTQQLNLYADLTKPYFAYTGVTEETLNTCNQNWLSDALYYYPDEGRPLTSDNARTLPLDESQIHTLKTAGILFEDDCVYSAARLRDGWLFMAWGQYQSIYNTDFPRIAEACPRDLCIIDNATGEALVSTGERSYDFLDESRISIDEKRSLQAADGVQAGRLRGRGPFSGVFFVKSRLLERCSVFVYVPCRSVWGDALRKTLPVHGLIILCFVFIWLSARKLREKGLALLAPDQCLRVGRGRCFCLPMLRQLLGLVLTGVLSAALIGAYLPLLTGYISHNAKMEKNLSAFIREIELNDEEWRKMEELYQRVVWGHISMIDFFSDTMGEDFTQDDLADLARRMNYDSVVIYDGDGVSTMSTTGYTGYTISQNPDDEEHNLWNLLRNADVGIMGELPDKSGFYAAARRLYGKPGLIYVTLPDDSLVEMKEQTDIRAALLRIDTETYAKMYTAAAAPETFLWATASSAAVRSVPNTLPETVLMNRYCGSQVINGYEYYLNTMTDDNHVLIGVEELHPFFDSVRKALHVVVPELLVLSLLILCDACIFPCPAAWAEKKPAAQAQARLFSQGNDALSPVEQALRLELRKKGSTLLWLLCVALVFLFFADAICARRPISDYLFSHQWQREPSIFSLTTIILSVLFLAVGMKALKSILRSLSAHMDSRAETFGDLVISIIQFLLTVVVVIYSLHELGVNTSVILTSAGVVSLIIGYGSQSIVSDLVSGIFLIMEDQVRIGEFIQIDGFVGKVEHIGLRTTRISNDVRAKVISNARMVGFDNLSRHTSPARWSVGLPQYVDPERVKALIADNAERFRETLGDRLIRGPVCSGMDKILWGGQYVLVFAAFCKMDDWYTVCTACLEISYQLLRENDITPLSGEMLPL